MYLQEQKNCFPVDSVGFVSLYDFSNSNMNEDNRIKTVSKIASLSYGNKEAKNSYDLYDKLIKRGHYSVLEFIRHPKKPTIDKSLRNNPDLEYTKEEEIPLVYENLALFQIKVPIFVMRQYIRHRSFSYLEMSRRYVSHKKNCFEFYKSPEIPEQVFDLYKEVVLDLYEGLLCDDVPTEVARTITPVCIYTTSWVLMDWIGARNFFVERYSIFAQREIRQVVKAHLELLKKYQPQFKGARFTVLDYDFNILEEDVFLLDIPSKFTEYTKVLVDFEDKRCYGVFDIEKMLFTGKLVY